MKKIYLSVFCLLSAFVLKAEDNPTKALGDSTKSPLTLSGYLDTYYFANFNNPASRSNTGSSGVNRAFDQKSDQFQVGLAQLKTTYSTDKVDGVIDLVFGNHADLGNYGNVLSPLGSTSTALAIKQAYFTWKPSEKWAITAGQFGTNIGYEVIDAPVNYNYSLSNLFNLGPFYHTGIKAAYTLSSKATLMAGIVNGLDSKDDNNKGKGVIAQLTLAPKAGYTVYLNYFGSNESSIAGVSSTYSLFDVVGNFQVSSKFYLGTNICFGSQDSKNWAGYAFYTNYAFTDKFGLGARVDYFDNKDGARALLATDANGVKSIGTTVTSFTLTGNITISPNLLFKPELRIDSMPKQSSGVQAFEDSKGNYTKTSQTTFGGAFIFKF